MPRKQYQYHYIYKTTNTLNNKFYIGMHSTDDLNDDYTGSGKRLWYSINKHGKENHKTEILEYLPSREALKIREKQIVNDELINEELCMNITIGGEGGWEHANTSDGIKKRKASIDKWMKAAQIGWLYKFNNDKEFRDTHIERTRKVGIKGNIACNKKYPQGTFFGKTHSDETKAKMSLAKKGKFLGKDSAHYGTCWLYSLKEKKSIKVKPEEVNSYIIHGWIRGRKMKFN